LLLQSRSPDLALRARMQDALQSIQLHDTELTRDILLARAGLLPHYDALPQTDQHLRRALETLRTESAMVAGPAAQEMQPGARSQGNNPCQTQVMALGMPSRAFSSGPSLISPL
jgi:DAHL domain